MIETICPQNMIKFKQELSDILHINGTLTLYFLQIQIYSKINCTENYLTKLQWSGCILVLGFFSTLLEALQDV